MTILENMKSQSVEIDSISDAMRCQYRRPSGRRCKLAVTAPGAPFCFTHTQEFNKADSLNLKTALLTNHEGFQTAQGICRLSLPFCALTPPSRQHTIAPVPGMQRNPIRQVGTTR